MNLEQYMDMAGDSSISLEKQGPGHDVGVESGVGQKPIRHDGESNVHGRGLVSWYLTGGYRDLSDNLTPVLEESRTVGVLEADTVRIPDVEICVDGHVEGDSESGNIQGEIQIPQGDGVDSGYWTFGFEHSESQYEDDDT